MGMKLGVPGDGPGMVAGEKPTSARFLTTSEEMAGGVCGAGVDRNSDPLGSDSMEGNATARVGGEGGSIYHLSPFLINFYRSMGCLTASERVQFPLLSRSNPGRYVKDVKVDTDTDETPACTPPTRPRAEEEPRAVRVPRKRKWDGEADQSQREAPAAPARSRATHEPSSRPKQKARKLVLPASSADTGRAAERRNSPFSGEYASARVLGSTTDLPASKARKAFGPRPRHGTPTSVPATDREWSGGRDRRSCATQFQGIAEDFYGDRDPRLRGRFAFKGGGSGVGARHADGSALQAKAAEAQREFEKQRAKLEAELHSERAQNCILTEELVRHTRLLEQCQIAHKADEELLCRLQSQCDELRAHRAEAELQIVEFEGDNRRATNGTREELVARVNRCLRGYTRWEIAAQGKVTLHELEIRAAALMSGDSRSRRDRTSAKELEPKGLPSTCAEDASAEGSSAKALLPKAVEVDLAA
ncbi:hypothetical protein AXG93_2022s1010 [Marchantia polymorpha subsp. ruderalis]|uniref:Uncharacterized protein n=1 Tax=Marchantia polymorpha subsp. ruderalis TaxID=1480154 RepID=A0A176VXL9_MARPO|nr:hypothetical protein AXG93_2022s1010 [Marchantia polymorpha subsp. ruderalis]